MGVAVVAAMQFYMRTTEVTAEMDEMKLEGKSLPATPGGESGAGPVTVKQLFKDPLLRQPLFIACALAVIQQFSGINAVRTVHVRSSGDVTGCRLAISPSPRKFCSCRKIFFEKCTTWGWKSPISAILGNLGANEQI